MATRTAIAISIAYLGAAILIGWQMQKPSPIPKDSFEDVEQAPPPIVIPSPPVRDIEAYAQISERPLFVAGRRPPTADTPTARKVMREPQNLSGQLRDIRLTAILERTSEKVALIESTTGDSQQLKTGGKLSGWVVKRILDDRVELANGAQRQVLLLHRFDAVPAPRPANARVAARRARANQRAARQPAERRTPSNARRRPAARPDQRLPGNPRQTIAQ